jgi:colicin import membrane protein
MSTLAYFKARPDYAMGRAFLLAFAVHAVLLAVMFLGVRIQNRPDDVVAVELWEAPPPPPPPVPVLEAPKPPPPKPEPEPEVKKPDIAEKAPPPKPKPKPKPVPQEDPLERLLLREQAALEQRKLDEERRKLAEEQRRLADAQRKAESERVARSLADSARNKALGEYINRIRNKVRQNWILPADLQGNPEAIFDVVQLPTGEVLSVRLAKSSGNAAYDAAVERAILKSSPLPLPEPRSLFDRQLKLTFRPRD